MKEYLRMTRVSAAILFGALGAVALIASVWGILLAPFWIAAAAKLASDNGYD